jgi:hypothetical protein
MTQVVSRMMAFLFLEFPRLELIAEGIRYQSLIHSVDFIPGIQLATVRSYRIQLDFTHQYKPVWLIFLPLICSALLIFLSQHQFLFELITPWPSFYSNSLNRFAKHLAVETVIRLAVEYSFRMDGWRGYGIFFYFYCCYVQL